MPKDLLPTISIGMEEMARVLLPLLTHDDDEDAMELLH